MAHAEVILTEIIPSLGAEADVVKVRRGYARNFLIPQGKALEVTPSALRRVGHLKARRAEREARELTAAEELAGKLNKLDLMFTLETGDSGKAFGSITAKDIHDRIVAESGIDLPKHAVAIDRAIKDSGEHTVSIKVHADVTAKVRVHIATPKPPAVETPEGDEDGSKRAPRKRATAKS